MRKLLTLSVLTLRIIAFFMSVGMVKRAGLTLFISDVVGYKKHETFR